MAKHKNRETEKQNIVGTKVRYMGILGAKFVCVSCGRESGRAMVSEFNKKLYCDDYCIELSREKR